MNVRCPQCRTVYRVDPRKVPPGGIRARCMRCPGEIEVGPVDEAAPSVQTGAEVGAPADAAEATEAGGVEVWPEVGREQGEPLAAEGVAMGAEVAAEGGAEEGIEGIGADAETDEVSEPLALEPTDTGVEEDVQPAAIATAGEEEIPSDGEGRAAVDEVPVAAEEDEHAGAETGAAAADWALPPPPFGSADPDARARRLARALVSDIVVYHRDRRERSLRQGTLRQEFREEIRKSWDEYVAQVGNEIARETSYFREALNEILAEGARLF